MAKIKPTKIRLAASSLAVFYPDTCTVWVYQANGQVTHPSVEDTLSGEKVLPDFTYLVGEVFPGQYAPPGA